MTNQAVYLALVRKIEILALPSITGMTRCATSLVAFYVNSKIVNRKATLPQSNTGLRRRIHPGPVNGLLELLGSF